MRNSWPQRVEELSHSAEGNLIALWAWGVVAALLIAAYGAYCLVVGEATFIGTRPLRIVQCTGTPAMCIGVALIAVACFMHLHFVWSHHERYWGLAALGKTICAAALAMALVYAVIYIFAFM